MINSNMNDPIEVKNLYYGYSKKDKDILKGIDINVKKGEVVAIVGLSGSGKSTLCYCMCGIIPRMYKGNLKGDVCFYGQNIKDLKFSDIFTKVGIVFQDPDTQLFSPTVESEIAFGPENLCIDRNEIGVRINDCLEQVKMKEFRYSNPNNLSGGQKQLIALASVLSLKPDVLIFDEVMCQVDKEGKKQIKNIIEDLKKSDKTIIMIEHDMQNLDIADRVYLLKDGKLEDFKGGLL